MRYTVYTRAANVGGGWRKWRTFEADTPAQACDLAFPNASYKPSTGNAKGTRHSWLHVNGCSEIMAELETQTVTCPDTNGFRKGCGHSFEYESNDSGQMECPKCGLVFHRKPEDEPPRTDPHLPTINPFVTVLEGFR
jgi:hypothetical protein